MIFLSLYSLQMKVVACPDGSIMRGYLLNLFNMIAFSVQRSSAGRASACQRRRSSALDRYWKQMHEGICDFVLCYYKSHDITKPTKWVCAQWRLRSSESLLCAQWVAKDPSFLHAYSEDWSDWVDARADLSLRWAHTRFVGFVMSRLIRQCNGSCLVWKV